MNKMSCFFTLLLLSTPLFSMPKTIDVYGVDDATAQVIVEKNKEQIEEYLEIQSQIIATLPKDQESLIIKSMALQEQIIKNINQYGSFKFVTLSPINYPNQDEPYTTIDIVQTAEAFRMPHSPTRAINPSLALTDEEQEGFALWYQYFEDNMNLLSQGKYHPEEKTCPVLHCAWGFSQQELIDYLPKFLEFSKNHRAILKEIIQTSSNDEQRGHAIFLLAHDDDYQSSIRFLAQFIDDESALVRNNSLRVIAAILAKHKENNLPLDKLLQALNYPLVTDRNKAALVIQLIAQHDKSTHKQILAESGHTLLALLKLKQPNNHNEAFQILKTISKIDHSDTDISFWENWLKAHE